MYKSDSTRINIITGASLFLYRNDLALICTEISFFSVLFQESAETLLSWASGDAVLCRNQNEPAEHAVLRERRNAPSAPRRHDRGWVWLPVIIYPPQSTNLCQKDVKTKRMFKRSNAVEAKEIYEPQKENDIKRKRFVYVCHLALQDCIWSMCQNNFKGIVQNSWNGVVLWGYEQ